MRAARHASDEKRSAAEYKAEDGGVRGPRPGMHWCGREPA
jgi:hypothetical protein